MESSGSSLGFMNEKRKNTNKLTFRQLPVLWKNDLASGSFFFRFFLNRTVPPQLIEDWFFNELMTHSTWRNERLTIIFFSFFKGSLQNVKFVFDKQVEELMNSTSCLSPSPSDLLEGEGELFSAGNLYISNVPNTFRMSADICSFQFITTAFSGSNLG